jgi:hypothetical protein
LSALKFAGGWKMPFVATANFSTIPVNEFAHFFELPNRSFRVSLPAAICFNANLISPLYG